MANLKFNGVLPALVTEEELGHSPLDNEFKQAVTKVIKGNSFALRSKLRKQAEAAPDLLTFQISPEQQVDCLIEQATDTNILGKTFWGWEPFC